mmetsp:Transcript_53142/g.110840  ORF Transcript_53142/g.110840 Transcript_53142/m.110840 type:complete len:260 (+) Transcript_53142:3166-3945(+)
MLIPPKSLMLLWFTGCKLLLELCFTFSTHILILYILFISWLVSFIILAHLISRLLIMFCAIWLGLGICALLLGIGLILILGFLLVSIAMLMLVTRMLNWIFAGLLVLLSLLSVLFFLLAPLFRIRCLHPPVKLNIMLTLPVQRILSMFAYCFVIFFFFLMMLWLLPCSSTVSQLLLCLRVLRNALVQSILTSRWLCVVITSCVGVSGWSIVLLLLRSLICLQSNLVLASSSHIGLALWVLFLPCLRSWLCGLVPIMSSR